jgi:hypothetical protein
MAVSSHCRSVPEKLARYVLALALCRVAASVANWAQVFGGVRWYWAISLAL